MMSENLTDDDEAFAESALLAGFIREPQIIVCTQHISNIDDGQPVELQIVLLNTGLAHWDRWTGQASV